MAQEVETLRILAPRKLEEDGSVAPVPRYGAFLLPGYYVISATGICCYDLLLLHFIAIRYKCLKYLVFSLLSFDCVCVCVCVDVDVCISVCLHIQGVTGGTDQTSGECSLC